MDLETSKSKFISLISFGHVKTSFLSNKNLGRKKYSQSDKEIIPIQYL